MMNWRRISDEMMSWWWNDDEMMMKSYHYDNELMINCRWTDDDGSAMLVDKIEGFRAVWNNQT